MPTSFPLKSFDIPPEETKKLDPIRDFVLNPANEGVLQEALKLVQERKISADRTSNGDITANPTQILEVLLN